MKTLKKLSAISIIIAAVLLISCNEGDVTSGKSELTEASQKAHQQIMRDSLIAIFDKTLCEIESNLRTIREKEDVLILGENNEELSLSEKQKILRDIEIIHSLMEENKRKIHKLNRQLAQTKEEKVNLMEHLAEAEIKVRQYEEKVAVLKDELYYGDMKMAELDKKLFEMELKNQMLRDRMDAYEEKAGKAYYTYGSYKELEASGIVKKEGGFLGIGRTKDLKDNLPEEKFTEIDIRETTHIPLHAKKVQLITDHPADSYEFRTEEDLVASLEIKNPEAFWKVSRYMVLEVR